LPSAKKSISLSKKKVFLREESGEVSDGERHGGDGAGGDEGVPAVQGEVLPVGKHAAVLQVPPLLLRLPSPRRPEEVATPIPTLPLSIRWIGY
jgi:hypothetical protein